MMLGLDRLIYGGEFGAWFFYLGLYWSSLATVTLAEDVAEVAFMSQSCRMEPPRLADSH